MCYFDQKGKVGRSGGETTKGGRAKLYAKLKAEDIVAMEVNSLAFVMEKEMRVIGCTVVILDASQLSIIYSSTKKTDKEDALKLARLVKIYEKECLFSAAEMAHHQLMNFLVHQLIANFGKAKISLLTEYQWFFTESSLWNKLEIKKCTRTYIF